MVQVHVDRDRCDANGLCLAAAPDVLAFDDDDELIVLVSDVTPAQQAGVRLAVKICPTAALSISE